MRLSFILLIFTFIMCSFFSKAQMEAAVWPVDSGMQMNFQSGSFQFLNFESSPNANATICDKSGNLLLITDGDTVWNRKNEILVNGTDLIEEGYIRDPSKKTIFIPYPGKEGTYLLIYSYGQIVQKEILIYSTTYDSIAKKPFLWVEHTGEYYETYGDFTLAYAEIDINAESGRGKVISKQNFIQSNFGELTVSGYCNNSYYWMAVAEDEPVKKYVNRPGNISLHFYKIDEGGISNMPQIKTFDEGDIKKLKFSPNGDKIYFAFDNYNQKYTSEVTTGGILYDFNFLTGEIYNYRNIGPVTSQTFVEFSPDSHLLYLAIEGSLVQFDVRYTSFSNVINSRDTIFMSESTVKPKPDYILLDLQLTPDGKIYVLNYAVHEKKYTHGWIHKPNQKGKDCNLRIRTSFFKNNIYSPPPIFITSFFRDKSLDLIEEQDVYAGPDKEVCFMSKVEIGTDSNSSYDIYQWFPETYLINPMATQDTFVSAWVVDTTKYTLTLRATDGNCWINFDDMEVTVYPRPPIPEIDGSWHVCPFSEGVDYWVTSDVDQRQFFWTVSGGKIIGDNTSDSIKVNWGDENPLAKVYARVISEMGCESKGDLDTVIINPELQPETPVGYNYLCIDEARDVVYKTKNTKGSVYEWIVDGGIIIEGQGTNEIRVEWKHDGDNKIFVREYSETSKSSCFGETEPLRVRVVNDTIQIELSYVSFTVDNRLEVYFISDKLSLNYQTLIQHTENVNTGYQEDYYPINTGLRDRYVYWAKPEETGSQIISLEVIGRCGEIFQTTQQQSIVLSGDVHIEQATVSLHWNLNQFWNTDKIKHEIWHSEDGKNNWKLIATLDRQTYIELEYPDVSLTHYIRVKEINVDKNIESWSNTINFQVSERLKIPDVFTPNGDGYNDTWDIWNTEAYIFKSLTVYSKSGEVIYHCKNGFIPWNGTINGRVYEGTYFYELNFERLNTRYGQITVLK